MTDETLELKLARQAYAEAEWIKKAAEQDLEAARYERGQIEHAKRLMEQTEKSIAQREKWLKDNGEKAMRAREAAVEAKLAEVRERDARYDKDRHAAAIALREINKREKAESSAAA
jgi:hypothetical protein